MSLLSGFYSISLINVFVAQLLEFTSFRRRMDSFFHSKKPNTSRNENISNKTVNKRVTNTEAGREGFHSEHICCLHYA